MPLLWRYRSIHHEPPRSQELEQLLSEGVMFAPAAHRFNDPFDLLPVVKFSAISREENIRYSEDLCTRNKATPEQRESILALACSEGLFGREDTKKELAAQFQKVLSDTPVLSFFDSELSTYMWAHYAASGSGYVVGIRFDSPLEDGEFPLPVRYVAERPSVDFAIDHRQNPDALEEMMRNCFLTKSKDWSQEREQRIIFPDKTEGPVHIGAERVTEICLGPKVTSEDQEKILAARRSSGVLVPVSQIGISSSGYHLSKNLLKRIDEP